MTSTTVPKPSNAFSEYLFLIQFGPAILASVPILAIDLADMEMKIIYATPLLEYMFGYEEGELRGQSLDILLKQQDVSQHHLHFATYQTGPTTRTMNKGVWADAVRKDGSIIKIQVSLCVQPVGKIDCVVACVADVTNAYERNKPIDFNHGEVVK